jgi:hypothetical protein
MPGMCRSEYTALEVKLTNDSEEGVKMIIDAELKLCSFQGEKKKRVSDVP